MQHLSFRTVFGTVLALSALEVVASSSAASGRVGGALQGLSTAAQYLMSPSKPLVPDLRHQAASTTQTALQTQEAGLTLPSLPPVQG